MRRSRTENIRVDKVYLFDWIGPEISESVRFNQAGRHNLENAMAALHLRQKWDGTETTCPGQSHFPGVRRRTFILPIDTILRRLRPSPMELHVLIEAMREWHPKKKLTLIFQPHLFSRTRISLEFAEELGGWMNSFSCPYGARRTHRRGDRRTHPESLSDQENRRLRQGLLDLLKDKKPELLVAGARYRLLGGAHQKLWKW